jgi:hypothetical protein
MPKQQIVRRVMQYLLMGLASVVGIALGAVAARAQDYSSFHEIETKYIFGNFTVGSATGIEGEKAFEMDSQADFGKRAGRYGVTETELEFEYTPTQYMQIEVGPTVSCTASPVCLVSRIAIPAA